MNVKRQIIEDEKVFEWHKQYEVEERTKAQFFNRKVDEQTIIQAAKALAQENWSEK